MQDSNNTLKISLKRSEILFIILVILYVVYALLFIEKTSFYMGEEKYYCLFDDAMISMRYAKNLANGYGLVWNPGGEHVEGYSNLLWVLYMAAVHKFTTGISQISRYIQLTEMILIVLSLYFIRKIALKLTNSEEVALGAAFLTAFYYPINNWSLQGMDVGPVLFILCFIVWEMLKCLEGNKVSKSLFVALGIGTLIRLDFIVLFFSVPLFLMYYKREQAKEIIKLLVLATFAFLVSQTLFRIIYYDDWLPNTYYLKVSGIPLMVRILKGILVTADTIKDLTLPIFLLPFTLLLTRKFDSRLYFLFYVITIQILYSIYVGGDAWEWYGGTNRYMSVIMPFLFITMSLALHHIISTLIEKKLKIYSSIAFTLAILAILYTIHVTNSISYTGTDAIRSHTEELLLQKPPLHIEEHMYSVYISLFLEDTTLPNARVLTVLAGAPPYFSDRYFIDGLGKNDKYIAKSAPKLPEVELFKAFHPGHVKCDGNHSILDLKPDVILQIWCGREELKQYLDENYINIGRIGYDDVLLLKNSSNILWYKFSLQQQQQKT